MTKELSVQKSIIKTYRKEIWSQFIKAIKTYQLVTEGDKIAVCLSGGKDSFLLAKCLQELQKHGVYCFELVFLVMDPGYSAASLNHIKALANELAIPIQIYQNNIFAQIKNEKNACYLCAKKRRGYLYSYAQELGCNKIALGHHFDDVVETILLNITYNGRHQTMLPKLTSQNFAGVELIRPLYLVAEKDIQKWQQQHQLNFLACACIGIMKDNDKRTEIKNLIAQLEKTNPNLKINLFNASKNVNLDALLGYKKNNQYHSFY